MRVALKDPHHTREAMSTAKSIRALSVHTIAYESMKPDSGLINTHTQRATREIKTIRDALWCCHTEITWRNVKKKILAIDDWKVDRATHIASTPFSKPYVVSSVSSCCPEGKQNQKSVQKISVKNVSFSAFFLPLLSRSCQTAPYLKPPLRGIFYHQRLGCSTKQLIR